VISLELFFVGLGGSFGALCRFCLARAIAERTDHDFPRGTFLINISGAALLGLVTGLGTGNSVYLLFGIGFLGTYSTFSTFMYEGFGLIQGRARRNALAYILGSLILGVAGYVCGYAIGRFLI